MLESLPPVAGTDEPPASVRTGRGFGFLRDFAEGTGSGLAGFRRAARTAAPAGDQERWNDTLWATVVGSADAVLRRYYGVREFTTDPTCVLRIAMTEARADLRLADATEVRRGDPVGVVHLWNEHLPRFASGGPDLHWANAMRHRIQHSLAALASHVETDPEWLGVRAFCACAALSGGWRKGRVQRVARRYGFDLIETGEFSPGSLRAIGEDIVIWALTRAFNPVAVRRQPFLRPRQELWTSRQTLLARYGRDQATTGVTSAAHN